VDPFSNIHATTPHLNLCPINRGLYMDLSKVNFKEQFCLSHDSKFPISGWQKKKINDKYLHHDKSIPVLSIFDSVNREIGWLIGYAIDVEYNLIDDKLSIPFDVDQRTDNLKIEKLISELAGRFVAFFILSNFERVYTDPGGQLSVVYNKSNGLIGSSPIIVGGDVDEKSEVFQTIDIPNQDNFYPFGLTALKRVYRILPNHYLDMKNLTCKRFWPINSQLDVVIETNEINRKISEHIKGNISAVVKKHNPTMALTAGMDSRMLLAASIEFADFINFYTVKIPDRSARLDCKVAIKLAKKKQLRHEVIKFKKPNKGDLLNWQIRVGYSMAGRTWLLATTLGALKEEKVDLPGLCGEVGRSYYWRSSDLTSNDINPETLLRRMHLPMSRVLLDEAEKWLKNIPLYKNHEILDFLYIEQRLGCWAGPSSYGHINRKPIVPMSDRKIFKLMLKLPPEYRFQQRMAKDIIKILSPDLHDIPFNKDTKLNVVIDKIKNKIKWMTKINMHRLKRKISR
jgi:hypothetical protein